jgi:hypothetical protein
LKRVFANKKLNLTLSVIFFVTIFQILFAVYRYPLLASDGIAFLPAAINYGNHNGLINEVYTITRLLNGNNTPALYINYPPIFPLLFGFLYRFTLNLHLIFAFVHILLILLFVFISNSLFNVLSSARKVLVLILFILAWNTQLSPGTARPESLGQLFFLLLVICSVLYRNKVTYFLSGLFVVCIGFTHPVLGVYSCFLLLIYYVYVTVNFKSLFLVIAGFIYGLYLVISVYPYNFKLLIDGILRHGEIVTGRSEFSIMKFINYHLTNPDITFYFLVFISSLCCYYFVFKCSVISQSNKILLFFLHVVLISVILYFTFQTIEASYNLYVLFPLFGFLILSNSRFLKSNLKFYSILFFLFLSSFGFIRRIVLFPFHLTQGHSFKMAKSELYHLDISNKKIFIPTSFYILFENMQNLTDDIDDPLLGYVIQQQNFSSVNQPARIAGFDLVHSTFCDSSVKILGLKLASSPPGYQYALYKKNIK